MIAPRKETMIILNGHHKNLSKLVFIFIILFIFSSNAEEIKIAPLINLDEIEPTYDEEIILSDVDIQFTESKQKDSDSNDGNANMAEISILNKTKMRLTLKNIFIVFSTCILLSGIAILSILWAFSNNLPDYKFLKNYKPPVSSKVYAGEGELVSDFSSEKRIFIPYKSIPIKIVNSFLSAEDKNFFNHPGVDAKGVLRAIINNISI